MSLHDNFQRVSREFPCPMCGRPDWCMVSRDDPRKPSQVICARTESHRRWGDAGWLHRFGDRRQPQPQSRRTQPRINKRRTAPRFGPIAIECQRTIQTDSLDALADHLGLSITSIQRLGIGWSQHYHAWTFPMYAAACRTLRVVGIRLRKPNGQKLAIRGSRAGLFIPDGLSQQDDPQPIGAIIARTSPLFICEGPTDTAAMLDLGFHAIGRPSCNGGTAHITALLKATPVRHVVVMADADTPGQRGAEALAKMLIGCGVSVQVMTPPSEYKDVRAWKQSGLLSDEIIALTESEADSNGQ